MSTSPPALDPAAPFGALTPRLQTFVILLLLLALPIAYLPQIKAFWGERPDSVIDGQTVYIADLDFWQRTDRETAVVANAHFDLAHDLNDVPLTTAHWHGKTVPETNEEVMILLEPEQYVQRLYQRDTGEYIWLSMIGGRSSQPFHAPDICYDADGWQYNLGSYPVTLGDGGKLYGFWLEAEKPVAGEAPLKHIVFYFYLFPNETRKLSDGIVLFKLTSGRHGTVQETLELHAEFIREYFLGIGHAVPDGV
ncbi:MAG: exosortase-associated EpsI family protein [Caldilineaceae bacterium]